MRPQLLKLGSELWKAQRLLAQKRLMGYEAASALTVRERAAMNNLDMDSLPVPQGDWTTEYSKVQTGYHIHMVISLALFVGMSAFFLKQNYASTPEVKRPLNLEEFYKARLAKQQENE